MIINRINVFVNFIIILTLLFVKSYSYAQYYDIGQDPANTSWNQISTSHFKIIFPKQYEKQAQYLANYIERIYAKSTKTLVSKPKNIPIILHTQSVISNAYTIWAPKRMEFFTIPPQDSYGQEWLQQLAIHEFRHVIQINKIKKGTEKKTDYNPPTASSRSQSERAPRGKIFEALIPPLVDLIQQIERHLDYYQTHASHEHLPPNGKGVSKILLCGGGANLKGLPELLSLELKIPVELGNPWINILPTSLKELPDLPLEKSLAFTTAIGLALRGIKSQ